MLIDRAREPTLSPRELAAIAAFLRRSVFQTCLTANNGHVGGSAGAVELLVSLYFGNILRFDVENPKHPDRDLVLVRGHLGPLRYSLFSLLGWIDRAELDTYRRFGSRLQGHEEMSLPGVDITPSGSLGMLLSYATGAALAFRPMSPERRMYVFLGDGEEQEGSVAEAARHIAAMGLLNINVIIDRNRKQLSGATVSVDSGTDLNRLWSGAGWQPMGPVDGHNLQLLIAHWRSSGERREVLIADTVKGRGLQGAEAHFCGYHTAGTCSPDIMRAGIQRETGELESLGFDDAAVYACVKRWKDSHRTSQERSVSRRGGDTPVAADTQCLGVITRPEDDNELCETFQRFTDSSSIQSRQKIGSSFLFGLAGYFRRLSAQCRASGRRLTVITADLMDEEVVELTGLNRGTEFIDVGLREQHAVSLAHGMAASSDRQTIVLFCGDSLIYRAADQVNALAQSGLSVILIGALSGLTNSRNGSTHQSSGQPGAMLTMPRVTLLEPSDMAMLYSCMNWALQNPGVNYLRLHGGDWTSEDWAVEVDGVGPTCRVAFEARNTNRPDLVLVASGIEVFMSSQAAKTLSTEYGLSVRVVEVINLSSPAGLAELLDANAVLTVYNGNAFVLGAIVATALLSVDAPRAPRVRSMGFDLGTSGHLPDLLAAYRLDAAGIVDEAMKWLDLH